MAQDFPSILNFLKNQYKNNRDVVLYMDADYFITKFRNHFFNNPQDITAEDSQIFFAIYYENFKKSIADISSETQRLQLDIEKDRYPFLNSCVNSDQINKDAKLFFQKVFQHMNAKPNPKQNFVAPLYLKKLDNQNQSVLNYLICIFKNSIAIEPKNTMKYSFYPEIANMVYQRSPVQFQSIFTDIFKHQPRHLPVFFSYIAIVDQTLSLVKLTPADRKKLIDITQDFANKFLLTSTPKAIKEVQKFISNHISHKELLSLDNKDAIDQQKAKKFQEFLNQSIDPNKMPYNYYTNLASHLKNIDCQVNLLDKDTQEKFQNMVIEKRFFFDQFFKGFYKGEFSLDVWTKLVHNYKTEFLSFFDIKTQNSLMEQKFLKTKDPKKILDIILSQINFNQINDCLSFKPQEENRYYKSVVSKFTKKHIIKNQEFLTKEIDKSLAPSNATFVDKPKNIHKI